MSVRRRRALIAGITESAAGARRSCDTSAAGPRVRRRRRRAVRATPRFTNQRATTFTSSVSTKSTRPAAISAARCVSLFAASPNSLAITAASV